MLNLRAAMRLLLVAKQPAHDGIGARAHDGAEGVGSRALGHGARADLAAAHDRIDQIGAHGTHHGGCGIADRAPEKPKSLGAYFAKITRNIALNRIERSSAKKRGSGELPLVLDELDYCVPSSHSTEAAVDARILSAVINRFLSSQKETARAIFLKRYWYMYPISEIAAETGFSESKVKVTLMRTRNALREYLGREDFNV